MSPKPSDSNLQPASAEKQEHVGRWDGTTTQSADMKCIFRANDAYSKKKTQASNQTKSNESEETISNLYDATSEIVREAKTWHHVPNSR
jgi:hypothetical protein